MTSNREAGPDEPQAVPYDRWPGIKPGSRVRIDCIDGTVATLIVAGASNGCIESERHGFPTHSIARVFLLDEPDPDADLIERIVDIVGDPNHPTAGHAYARAIIAAVREFKAGV